MRQTRWLTVILAAAILVPLAACSPASTSTDPTAGAGVDPAAGPTLATVQAAPEPTITKSVPPTPTAQATPTPTPTPTLQPSRVVKVGATQWQAMVKAGMIRPECPIQRADQLRRVDLNFVNFEGKTERGYLIVNKDVASTVKKIFDQLYVEKFPIRQMVGVEEFGGNVNDSLAADNTSSFNCRQAGQINAPFLKSPHANGRAIDINPRENPWIDPRCKCWNPTATYAKRTKGPGKIIKNGIVWKLFTKEGWIWQDIDVADYMHFDTGYPSAPYTAR